MEKLSVPARFIQPLSLSTDKKHDIVTAIYKEKELNQFLNDWEEVCQMFSQQENMQNAKFPARHEHIREFVVDSVHSNEVVVGSNQTISVYLVPGYQEEGKTNQFVLGDEEFSIEAPMLFRPNPLEVDISQIVVRETEDNALLKPATLEQYMENKGIGLNELRAVDIYCAVAFVPICSSEKNKYTTQLMIKASSPSGQWYKPILQGKAYGGPIVQRPHNDYSIDMIEEDKKGKYWKVTPIDVFGEYGQNIFGSDTGRLVIVDIPQKERLIGFPLHFRALELGDDYGPEGTLKSLSMTETHISAGGDTGRNYKSGNVDIDYSRNIKAFSLLTIGVRPETSKELSLEQMLPYLATGK